MISITSFSNSSKNSDTFHLSHHISDKKNISDNSPQLLIEENTNENETEDGFELQAIFIPFLISCLSIDSLELPLISVAPLIEKLTNPIYLSVCNFRI